MSIDATTIRQVKVFSLGQVPAWLWLGVGLYAYLLVASSGLLNDSDTYWQIAVGQWILDHRAMPRVDVYSFSMPGEAWISSSWLAQVLYAASYNLAGWAGPVVVAAGGIAATFALLAHILERRVAPTYAILVALAAVVLSMPHFLARPHVLVMPLMLAWAHGLMMASERRQPPSLWLLPLIALWANLHGGFVFGLVLAGAFAIDALWNAEPSQRRPLALRWSRVRAGRAGGLLRHALRLGIDPRFTQDSRSWRTAAAAQRMGAGGFQQAQFVRVDDPRF